MHEPVITQNSLERGRPRGHVRVCCWFFLHVNNTHLYLHKPAFY